MARNDRQGVRGAWSRAARSAVDEEDETPPPPVPTAGPLNVEGYLSASLGPPRWLERLQDIEAEEQRALDGLRRAWLDLAERNVGDPDGFAAAWPVVAAAFDLSPVNVLVAQHNEYFPIERRLPFDLPTGDYRAPWGIPWRRRARDLDWVLSRLPSDLAAARAAPARRG